MRSRSNASASSAAGRLAGRVAGSVVLLLALAGASRSAEAGGKKKIVLLTFGGPKASRVQQGVVKLMQPYATVVPGKVFIDAADKVPGYHPDPAGVARVSKQIQVHGLLLGKVSKSGRDYSLTLQIREGRSGEFVGDGITVPLRGGRLIGAAKRKLGRELKVVLNDLPDPAGQEGAGDDAVATIEDGDDRAGDADASREEPGAGRAGPAPSPPPRSARAPVSERPRGKRVASADAAAAPRGSQENGEGTGPEGSVASAAAEHADRDTRGRAIDASAGVSFVSRKLTFEFADGLQDLPQGYDGALVPGIYATAELYPMALADRSGRGFAHDIGITLKVDRVLIIKSELPGQAGADSLPTSQTRYGAGLVYRWNFGSSPTSPTLKVGAGYNVLSFTIDEQAADDPDAIELPDVAYTYIDPGLGLRLPLGDRFAALAEAHYLYVLDAGQIEDADRYGTAGAVAFDADVGAEVMVTSNFMARLGARFTQVGLSFDGNGDLTERTNDGMQDVTSSNDRYLGFYATAGLLF